MLPHTRRFGLQLTDVECFASVRNHSARRLFSSPMLLAKPTAAVPSLPDRVRLLYVTPLGQPGDWLRDVFESETAARFDFDEAIGVANGMARMRDEAYDIVLVSHTPGVLDSLAFVEALRTADQELAVVVLGTASVAELEPLAFAAGADAYCCATSTTTRSLLWLFARAIEHRSLLSENHRLVEAQRQRLASEHREAQQLLAQQRSLVAELQQIEADEPGSDSLTGEWRPKPDAMRQVVPSELIDRYRELMQTYVVMGSGNLAGEMTTLVDRLAARDIAAQAVMQMHIDVLETMVVGLGNRSARHVMTRADLLLVELVVHLADAYRDRYNESQHRPVQQWLPGFDLFDDDRGSEQNAAA